MKFEIEQLPEDSDAILSSLHSELMSVVSGFEAEAEAILTDQNRTPVWRARDLASIRRDVLTELDLINQTLIVDGREFTRRKRELRRIQPVSGDSLQRYIEARSILRAATSAKRKTFLQDAVEMKDRLMLQAVIDGPSYLSGLTAEEHAAFSEQAHDALHGVETRELEQAEALASSLMQQIEKARTHINDFEKEDYSDVV